MIRFGYSSTYYFDLENVNGSYVETFDFDGTLALDTWWTSLLVTISVFAANENFGRRAFRVWNELCISESVRNLPGTKALRNNLFLAC